MDRLSCSVQTDTTDGGAEHDEGHVDDGQARLPPILEPLTVVDEQPEYACYKLADDRYSVRQS